MLAGLMKGLFQIFLLYVVSYNPHGMNRSDDILYYQYVITKKCYKILICIHTCIILVRIYFTEHTSISNWQHACGSRVAGSHGGRQSLFIRRPSAHFLLLTHFGTEIVPIDTRRSLLPSSKLYLCHLDSQRFSRFNYLPKLLKRPVKLQELQSITTIVKISADLVINRPDTNIYALDISKTGAVLYSRFNVMKNSVLK